MSLSKLVGLMATTESAKSSHAQKTITVMMLLEELQPVAQVVITFRDSQFAMV